jgi:hypothetical protein
MLSAAPAAQLCAVHAAAPAQRPAALAAAAAAASRLAPHALTASAALHFRSLVLTGAAAAPGETARLQQQQQLQHTPEKLPSNCDNADEGDTLHAECRSQRCARLVSLNEVLLLGTGEPGVSNETVQPQMTDALLAVGSSIKDPLLLLRADDTCKQLEY